jgi:hypothetical protein
VVESFPADVRRADVDPPGSSNALDEPAALELLDPGLLERVIRSERASSEMWNSR